MAADLPNLANSAYLDRVNLAIDHVTRNLADPLQLDDVARVAGFSSFHFHRIFKNTTGETLAQFVKRLRLERALYLMSHRPEASLTEIALACGLSSSSDFSRSFRDRYGVPPSAFDVQSYRDARRTAMHESATGHLVERLPIGDNPDGFVARIRPRPARHVAYIRVTRPYVGGVPAAVARLLAWATARDLADGQWLGYQWDDPELVELANCRYDVGLEVSRGTASSAEGDVLVTEFPAMTVAEVDVIGSIEREIRAIDWLFRTWLPTSGYAPAHQPLFEAWNGRPFAHGMEHFELRLHLPVIDASIPL